MSGWFQGNSSLSWQDYTIVLFFLLATVLIGFIAGRKEESTEDFFLGSRHIPWWAACLSFIATEISAVTIIAVPAIAFSENWEYAQFFVGSAIARIIIAFLFIPAFYHYGCTSIYEFLKHRFGQETQVSASIFFFITRLLASGVRLMAACLAISILVGWHIVPTMILFSLVSMIYISWGGIKAVIWTNVLQALAFISAGIVAILFIISRVDGGMDTVIQLAQTSGRLKVFNWGPSLAENGFSQFLRNAFKDPNIFWIATLNGVFGSMAAFGTDQELMQRLLTVETRQKSQRTMLLTIFGSFLVLMIFLSVGTCLYAFYTQNPGLVLDKVDKIFPQFIGQSMPPWMRGLMLSAVVLAGIDSPLNSLTTSFVTDIYRPLIAKNREEKHYLLVSRISVVVFGILLLSIAYFFSHFEKILWMAFKIGSVTYGSLLGIFLLGLLTKRKVNKINMISMVFSSLSMLTLLILSEMKVIGLGWSHLLVIGTTMTFLTSFIFSHKEETV